MAVSGAIAGANDPATMRKKPKIAKTKGKGKKK